MRSRAASGEVGSISVVADQPQEWLCPPRLRNSCVDCKRGINRHHRMQQRAIDQADVIGRDQHPRAGWRQVFDPSYFNAEERFEQERAEIANAFLCPTSSSRTTS